MPVALRLQPREPVRVTGLARSRARAPLIDATDTSQSSEGRMRSAQIAAFNAAESSDGSH